MIWILGYFIVGFGVSIALTVIEILNDEYDKTDKGLEARVMYVVAWPFLLLFFVILWIDKLIRKMAEKIYAIFWMDKEDK